MQNIDIITEIRGFNRFYTDLLGLLDQHILDSGYSLSEARILFEISKMELCTANQLCALLDIDRSYMSRIIRKFEKNGLLERTTDPEDNRNIRIHLTEKGMAIFHELNDRSNKQISDLLSKLQPEDREHLLTSLRSVKKYFTIATTEMRIRPYVESDIEYIIDRQLSLYEAERHFTSDIWRHYLIEGVHTLVNHFNPDTDCIEILECKGSPMGCIAITHTEPGTAQLRYFFLEPELRGLGAGQKLLDKAVAFCREKQYRTVFLWTVSAQESARKLYHNAGFRITETHENDEWGVPVLEERWDLNL